MGLRLRACIGVLMIVAALTGLPMAGAAPHGHVPVREPAPFVITNAARKSGFTVELWEEIAERRGWSTRYVDAENVGAQLKDVE